MTTQILDLNNIERKLFWSLLGCLGVVVIIYLYSAFSLMNSVVVHNRVSVSSREISATSGNLEQEYLSLKNSITPARAKELGFKDVPIRFRTDASLINGGSTKKFSSAY